MDFSDCPDVRVAEGEDFPHVMELTRLAHEEIGVHSYSENKVLNVVLLHFEKCGGLIGVIGEKGMPLKGYILMAIDSPWYSDDHILTEMNTFVRPEHRKSTYAKQLLAFSKHASNALNLCLSIGILSNERTAAKVRLYQRQFSFGGSFFIHHPQA
jgi:hypothetical protein